MTRIAKLEAEGFRGIRNLAPLDFGKACRSMAIYGDNARGKSSFVDAIECYFYERVGHLERENVGRSAYRHRGLSDDDVAWARLQFSETGRGGVLEIDFDRHLTFSPNTPDADDFRRSARQELLILRHRDLSRFVDMTKRQKLSDLAPLLGTEALDDTRGELRAALRQLEIDLEAQEGRISERRESIASRVGRPDYSDADLWSFASQEADALGMPGVIRHVSDLRALLTKVSVTPDPEREHRLRTLEDAKRQMKELSSLGDTVGSTREFARAFNDLALDQQLLQELALTDVREAGLRVLRLEWWTQNVCPLCSEPLRDRPKLVSTLEDHVSAAVEARERKKLLEARRDSTRATLRRAHEVLEDALDALAEMTECASVLKSGRQLLETFLKLDEALQTPLEPGARLAEDGVDLLKTQLESLFTARTASEQTLSATIQEMEPGDEERRRLSSYAVLSGILDDLERLERLAAEYTAIDTQVRSLGVAFEEFERLERATVSAVVEQLSDDVTHYFQRLYGGDRYSGVRLEFLPEERGLEFSLEAYGEQISPPRLVLSESQMNGLGLCLFLAAAREFNTDAEFVVLDDVVNSFDADHRAQLAELLVEEFKDYQVIAFTHDPVWFDILRQMSPTWAFQRIVGWTYEHGVQLELSPREERERIEYHIGRGEVSIAGSLAGTYIESRLKSLCLHLRVPLPYRSWYDNERRTIGELLRFLREHAGRQKHFKLRDVNIFNKLNASGLIRNLTSHHQPALPAPPASADVTYAIEKIDELVQQFHCANCGKWVWYTHLIADEFEFQCRCGQLEFR